VILGIGTIFAAAPARAQTYDPNFPVCMQVYGIGGCYITCSYASISQCALSASGGAAQCITNPYFVAKENTTAARRSRNDLH
jgi:hypothetical protein